MSITQFRLSTALLVILVLCVCLGWWRDRQELMQQHSRLEAKHLQVVKYDREQIKLKLGMINVSLLELRRALIVQRVKQAIELIETRIHSSVEVSRMDLEEYKRSIIPFQQEFEQLEVDHEKSQGQLELIRREFEEFEAKIEHVRPKSLHVSRNM